MRDLDLPASGLLDRLSVRARAHALTVEYHLRKVFGKLGISSRRELASAAQRVLNRR